MYCTCCSLAMAISMMSSHTAPLAELIQFCKVNWRSVSSSHLLSILQNKAFTQYKSSMMKHFQLINARKDRGFWLFRPCQHSAVTPSNLHFHHFWAMFHCLAEVCAIFNQVVIHQNYTKNFRVVYQGIMSAEEFICGGAGSASWQVSQLVRESLTPWLLVQVL